MAVSNDELIKDLAEVKTSLQYIQKSIDQLAELQKQQNKIFQNHNALRKDVEAIEVRMKASEKRIVDNEKTIWELRDWKITVVAIAWVVWIWASLFFKIFF